jgi:hypothetical protein
MQIEFKPRCTVKSFSIKKHSFLILAKKSPTKKLLGYQLFRGFASFFRLTPNLALVILLIRLTIQCILYGTLVIPESGCTDLLENYIFF